MTTKTAKLSPTMQKALDELINAPYADRVERDTLIHLANGESISASGLGKQADGTIKAYNSSSTIKALEKRGLIEVVKDGGNCSDTVRLLQHENKSVSLFEQYNLVPVRVWVSSSCSYRDHETMNYELVQDGNPEYAKNYWDHKGFRPNITRVTLRETGEEIYNVEKGSE